MLELEDICKNSSLFSRVQNIQNNHFGYEPKSQGVTKNASKSENSSSSSSSSFSITLSSESKKDIVDERVPGTSQDSGGIPDGKSEASLWVHHSEEESGGSLPNILNSELSSSKTSRRRSSKSRSLLQYRMKRDSILTFSDLDGTNITSEQESDHLFHPQKMPSSNESEGSLYFI